MAKLKGYDFVLYIEDTDGGGTYSAIASIQSKTLSINREPVEVGTHGDDQWRVLLAGAGQRSADISFDGVMDDSADKTTLRQLCTDGTQRRFRLTDGASRTVTAYFQVATFEWSGNHVEHMAFSCSLQSSAAVTFA